MECFGPQLQTKDGLKDTAEVLKGKYVGIYFSAHLQGKGLEIVFVSSDRDEAAFDEYFGEMPWVALPFADRDRKAALSKKFKVNGIPSFVLLDTEGKTITTDGRSQVSQDPTGEEFPWIPKPVMELLGETLQGQDGEVPVSVLEGKVVALYFSAHWCPPCRGFTPMLKDFYETIKGKSLPFEIIFVSSDESESE